MIGPTCAKKKDDKYHQTKCGNGAGGVAQADHKERTMIRVADENADRYGDSRGNPDRCHGIAQLLKQQVPNPAGARPISGIRHVLEDVHAAARFLNQGSVPRCTSKIKASKISDNVSIRIKAKMIGV